MRLAGRVFTGLTLAGATLLLSSAAGAQGRVGVVTNLEGTVMVARLTEPEAQPLRFKDDVYVHDRITTGERSVVRVLLGGKATVTARERSVLTITEVPGVATVELGEGRISVAVSKAMMKRGEIIEIKTPNAVTAIRGTVVVAEVSPGAIIRSTITVLRGLIDVTRLDRGRRVGRAVNVGAQQSITVLGSRPLASPHGISADEARRLASDFQIISSSGLSAAPPPALSQAVREATHEAETMAVAADARRNEPARRHSTKSGGHRNGDPGEGSHSANSNDGYGKGGKSKDGKGGGDGSGHGGDDGQPEVSLAVMTTSGSLGLSAVVSEKSKGKSGRR